MTAPESSPASTSSDLIASVIIPAYNAETVLPRCLDALSKQTVPRDCYEIIVVDDGSSDRTIEVAESYGVRVLRQAHLKQSSARNLGVSVARGRFVLFTDSDCIAVPEWIERMIAPFRNPEVAAVTGRYKTRQHSVLARCIQLEFEEKYRQLASNKTIDFVDSYAAAYRKDIFLRAGGFDTTIPAVEDIDLSFRCHRLGYTMVFRDDATVFHRHREELVPYLLMKAWVASWWVNIFRRNPGKLGNDSRKPKTSLVQIALSGLLTLSLPLALLRPRLLPVWLAGLATFAGTTGPVLRQAARLDSGLVPVVSGFVFVRALSQACGIAYTILMRRNMPRLD